MIRVERLVVPDAKSFCSTNSVRLPARAHSRATATPLIPPPITATWKCCPSSGARGFVAKVMYFQLDAATLGCSCGMLPKAMSTPRLFQCAPVRQFREGNYGTANVDGRMSNAVSSPGRQRKWAITCFGNPGRHLFGQKPGRAGVRLDVGRAYAIF